MKVRGLNLIKYNDLKKETEALTKIRYKDPGTLSTVIQTGEENAEVTFHAPVHAIAPGQSAVFYENNDVLGGGFIEKEQ